MSSIHSQSIRPTVSVIIPTTGRPTLRDAIASVEAQSYPVSEIIVVTDGPEPLYASEGLVVKSVATGERSGDAGATARNQGVGLATSQLVAFLDDDDEWLPDKLAEQVRHWEDVDRPSLAVIASRVLLDTGKQRVPAPLQTVSAQDNIPEYLFDGSGRQRGFLPTSGLLATRELAVMVPFKAGLRQHVDYDFCVRAWRAGAHFSMPEMPIVIMNVPDGRTSVTQASTVLASMAWGIGMRESLGRRAYAGFLLGDVVRLARRHRQPRLALQAAMLAIRDGDPTLRLLVKGLASYFAGGAKVVVRVRHLAMRARARHML